MTCPRLTLPLPRAPCAVPQPITPGACLSAPAAPPTQVSVPRQRSPHPLTLPAVSVGTLFSYCQGSWCTAPGCGLQGPRGGGHSDKGCGCPGAPYAHRRPVSPSRSPPALLRE